MHFRHMPPPPPPPPFGLDMGVTHRKMNMHVFRSGCNFGLQRIVVMGRSTQKEKMLPNTKKKNNGLFEEAQGLTSSHLLFLGTINLSS